MKGMPMPMPMPEKKPKPKSKPKPKKINQSAKALNWDGLSSLYIKLSPKQDHWGKILPS